MLQLMNMVQLVNIADKMQFKERVRWKQPPAAANKWHNAIEVVRLDQNKKAAPPKANTSR